MNKLAKGAIATATGGALLLGGAGTFALWNDVWDEGVDQPIATGQLQFAGTDPVVGAWHADAAGDVELSDTFLMVPGDTVYYVGTVNVLAEGDNLRATLGMDPGSIVVTPAGSADDLGITARFQNGGTIDVATGSGVLPHDFVLELTWDEDATTGRQGQNASIELSNVTFTLQQTRS